MTGTEVIISSRIRRARHVARMENMINAYGILIGKLKGKRPLGE
jgi:hypothetical protein